MADRPDIIPLFPLEKVLFPQMALPLHVFEERYKALISECLSHDLRFGILHGMDVREPVIGTTARVEKVIEVYDDGRLDILAAGERRFVVIDVIQDDKPYLQAKVQYIDDEPIQPPNPRVVDEMISLYRLYLERLGLEDGHQEQLEGVMDDVDEEWEMSYIIAQTIGLDLRGQQEVLETTDPMARVDLLTEILRRHDAVHGIARHLFEGDADFDPKVN